VSGAISGGQGLRLSLPHLASASGSGASRVPSANRPRDPRYGCRPLSCRLAALKGRHFVAASVLSQPLPFTIFGDGDTLIAVPVVRGLCSVVLIQNSKEKSPTVILLYS
jgi:hypothetical protein